MYVKYYSAPKNPSVIWISHMLIAIVFLTLGGLGLKNKPQNKLSLATSWILIIFGILMFAYHGHLFVMKNTEKMDALTM